ncbi:hypothetical protein [Polaribacter sp. HL-MS24]|nr:hypothetical protein [Polaribacter sp. HL-MS24]WOC39589.1 hypothetical protein RRF69_07920 [Polaribacter sp. HL-MS24]
MKRILESNQILKKRYWIGANLIQVNRAILKADFSGTISIAYKECLETK